MSAIYDGQTQVGSVSVLHEKDFTAFYAAGECLGIFQTHVAAVRAVLDAARHAALLAEIKARRKESDQ
ncbi:MAG: hypothetical protein WBV25_07300 [Methylocella sp.]